MKPTRDSFLPLTPESGDMLIPGAREPGTLTTFGAVAVVMPGVPTGRSTMDAVTIAEHEREGGGAPSQRTNDV